MHVMNYHRQMNGMKRKCVIGRLTSSPNVCKANQSVILWAPSLFDEHTGAGQTEKETAKKKQSISESPALGSHGNSGYNMNHLIS